MRHRAPHQMTGLQRKLCIQLKNARRVAVLGIGSELRGDDAAGLLVLERLWRNINTLRRAAARVAPVVEKAAQVTARYLWAALKGLL